MWEKLLCCLFIYFGLFVFLLFGPISWSNRITENFIQNLIWPDLAKKQQDLTLNKRDKQTQPLFTLVWGQWPPTGRGPPPWTCLSLLWGQWLGEGRRTGDNAAVGAALQNPNLLHWGRRNHLIDWALRAIKSTMWGKRFRSHRSRLSAVHAIKHFQD